MGKMNKMKEIADMLGVELNEKFYVRRTTDGERYCGKFYFGDDGLYGLYWDAESPLSGNGIYAPVVLSELLSGIVEIEKIQKHTGLEHPGYDEVIYNINGSQYTSNERETLKPDEYSDKQVRDNWARKQKIERRLYEAAAMLNSEPIDKLNENVNKWYIYWNAYNDELDFENTNGFLNTDVYFESAEAARQAIDIVGKDDLIWLFRDFQPYVGAYVKNEEEK